jgi:hypothetical protein
MGMTQLIKYNHLLMAHHRLGRSGLKRLPTNMAMDLLRPPQTHSWLSSMEMLERGEKSLSICTLVVAIQFT